MLWFASGAIGENFLKNQVELDTASALDLNDAILEPARETLIAGRRQAAFADVVDELEDDTGVSDSDVE